MDNYKKKYLKYKQKYLQLKNLQNGGGPGLSQDNQGPGVQPGTTNTRSIGPDDNTDEDTGTTKFTEKEIEILDVIYDGMDDKNVSKVISIILSNPQENWAKILLSNTTQLGPMLYYALFKDETGELKNFFTNSPVFLQTITSNQFTENMVIGVFNIIVETQNKNYSIEKILGIPQFIEKIRKYPNIKSHIEILINKRGLNNYELFKKISKMIIPTYIPGVNALNNAINKGIIDIINGILSNSSEVENIKNELIQLSRDNSKLLQDYLKYPQIKKIYDEIETFARARSSEEMQCGVCMLNEKDTALIPCGHMVCGDCAKNIVGLGNTNKCPFCRRPIDSKYKIFVGGRAKMNTIKY